MSRDPEPLIVARRLEKRYGSLTAVGGIDFDVARGEAFGILGPNGAGKTSTMRMLSCVTPVSGGTLRILDMGPATDGRRIKSRLGVVSQEDTLDMELTVRENLYVYGRYFGLARPVIRERTSRLLDLVELAGRADDRVEPLSGGMKRRLTIARSLINDPEVLLLDEPTTGLDPQARHVVWERLLQLKEQGVTLMLTTHYMDEAEKLCDRLVVMEGGRIIAEGSPRALIEELSTREVLELRLPTADHTGFLEKVDGVATRAESLPDQLLLYVDDGDGALEELHRRGLRPASAHIRRSTLEDVFLRLTGRTLTD